MMDGFIEDYVAYELFEEAFCVQTDVECPHCESNLLYDQEREVYPCADCRGEFVESADGVKRTPSKIKGRRKGRLKDA